VDGVYGDHSIGWTERGAYTCLPHPVPLQARLHVVLPQSLHRSRAGGGSAAHLDMCKVKRDGIEKGKDTFNFQFFFDVAIRRRFTSPLR
jgi:hypothetical protein